LPELFVIEATSRIVAASPHIAVLVVTMSEGDDSLFAAIRAGARGYIVKGADRAQIVRAIEAVADGEAIFAPSVALRIRNYFSSAGHADPLVPFPQLTDRERNVLDLIAEGRNNQSISQKLNVSVKTVRNHVSNIFTKLQVADRAEAIVRAREAGLGGKS
jgi:DNA-binding NarL/FixJ family response regulator